MTIDITKNKKLIEQIERLFITLDIDHAFCDCEESGGLNQFYVDDFPDFLEYALDCVKCDFKEDAVFIGIDNFDLWIIAKLEGKTLETAKIKSLKLDYRQLEENYFYSKKDELEDKLRRSISL